MRKARTANVVVTPESDSPPSSAPTSPVPRRPDKQVLILRKYASVEDSEKEVKESGTESISLGSPRLNSQDSPRLSSKQKEIERQIELVYEDVRLHGLARAGTPDGIEATPLARQMRRIAALQAKKGKRKEAITTLKNCCRHEDETCEFTADRADTLQLLSALYTDSACLFPIDRPTRRGALLRRAESYSRKRLAVLELLYTSESQEVALAWFQMAEIYRLLGNQQQVSDCLDTCIRLYTALGVELCPSDVLADLLEHDSTAFQMARTPTNFEGFDGARMGRLTSRQSSRMSGTGTQMSHRASASLASLVDDSMSDISEEENQDDTRPRIAMPLIGIVRLGNEESAYGGESVSSGVPAGPRPQPKMKASAAPPSGGQARLKGRSLRIDHMDHASPIGRQSRQRLEGFSTKSTDASECVLA